MAQLTVLGVGNILMRDEGLGVRMVEAVAAGRDWPDTIEFVDGGAGGLSLLDIIDSAERLVVFDAAQMHLAPGECRVIRPDEVTADADGRISMHDLSFMETLNLCGKFFPRPPTVILAVQPGSVDMGRQLSAPLAKAFDGLVQVGIELVAEIAGV